MRKLATLFSMLVLAITLLAAPAVYAAPSAERTDAAAVGGWIDGFAAWFAGLFADAPGIGIGIGGSPANTSAGDEGEIGSGHDPNG